MKCTLLIVATLLLAHWALGLRLDNPNGDHKGLPMAPGKFDRIFIIQFENQPYNYVKDDPFFKKYAAMGVLLTNYYGVTHPSQPNVRNPHFCKRFSALPRDI